MEPSFYVSVGDVVAGKYRVERVLGTGGMAFVLSARHVELDEPFALKFLDQKFLGNETITERFTQEARAACKIRSEHVARVYDVGIHEGAPFFVMEHLEGRDLCAVVAGSGPLPTESAVEYVMQACEALAIAHCNGIIHRDIKPENLFLVEREGLPVIKVLDFGISKVALTGAEASSRLTGELTLGTPCYMSPEQIRSTASADARSDLWSLGAVLYELLAGTEAFRAESVNALCAAVLEREPPPLGELRPDLPAGLVGVVMKCLQKDPDRRFADVAELAEALLPFAPSRALVSAERSSSVLRSARRVTVPEPRRHSNDTHAPESAAPVARSLELIEIVDERPSSDAAEPAPRRWTFAIAIAALGVAAAAVLLAAGAGIGERGHEVERAPAAAQLDAPVDDPLLLPTARRSPITARDGSASEGAIAVSALKRAAPPPAPAAIAVPSTSGSVRAQASAHGPAAATSAAATASAAVELGY
ncbi:MAG: serine/threonine protein kinase [Labilithrix sp.]|nr:serine/threonine protein kinase [Labilithrix sp.]